VILGEGSESSVSGCILASGPFVLELPLEAGD